jgi:hypothetical protein
MKKFYWKKKKTIAMYLNKRQAIETQGNVNTSSEVEIEMEHTNSFLITESSSNALPNYIITE